MGLRRSVAVGLVALVGSVAAAAVAARPSPPPAPRVLVFSKTAGFRHDSIPAALKAVRDLARPHGIVVEATENAAAFTPSNLSRYDAVVFLMTTGDVLNSQQQAAFSRFFRRGGGFVGVHSAADTEYGWAWYGRMLGTYFRSHPQIQRAQIVVQNRRHPSTVGLPRQWTRTDEWYNFTRNPRPSVRVLATLDETSYEPGPGAMGGDHPIAWTHAFEGGRAWFTGGGHSAESYSEPLFRRHLIGGIRYSAGLTPPRILSVASRVQNARLGVTVSYRSCQPCKGILRVRSARIPIAFAAGRARAQTPSLPRGRWAFTVVLEDPATGLADSARGSARVP